MWKIEKTVLLLSFLIKLFKRFLRARKQIFDDSNDLKLNFSFSYQVLVFAKIKKIAWKSREATVRQRSLMIFLLLIKMTFLVWETLSAAAAGGHTAFGVFLFSALLWSAWKGFSSPLLWARWSPWICWSTEQPLQGRGCRMSRGRSRWWTQGCRNHRSLPLSW